MWPEELQLLKSQEEELEKRNEGESHWGWGTLGVMATEPLDVSVRMRQSGRLCPTPIKMRTAECPWGCGNRDVIGDAQKNVLVEKLEAKTRMC